MLHFVSITFLFSILIDKNCYAQFKKTAQSMIRKNKLKKMMQAYEKFRDDYLLPVNYEIVYGNASVPEEKESGVVIPFANF